MTSKKKHHRPAAYGGSRWVPRTASMRQELGTLWAPCGVSNEWGRLKSVLMHRPFAELAASADPDGVQMLEPLDMERASIQHDHIADAYRSAGVTVHLVDPPVAPHPNQMFVADLMVMTPEGAIVCRPASKVRAGEERWIARRLADNGIPILRTISGAATFEGADVLWVDAHTVLIGRGMRTNQEGVAQLSTLFDTLGIASVVVDIPYGAMHLMGILRIVDKNLAVAWPERVAVSAVQLLRDKGYAVYFVPDQDEARTGFALNMVTLGPRKILMAAGNPVTQKFYENLGITCLTVAVDELAKAAGAIGCLTGVLHREQG